MDCSWQTTQRAPSRAQKGWPQPDLFKQATQTSPVGREEMEGLILHPGREAGEGRRCCKAGTDRQMKDEGMDGWKGGRMGLEHADTGCGTHPLAQCSHMFTVSASESPHRGCQLGVGAKD